MIRWMMASDGGPRSWPARRPAVLAAGMVVIASLASEASAQELMGAGESAGFALPAALALVALLPLAEALFYRLHLGVGLGRALVMCALLNLAAYGATVVWIWFLPGGVNPWFARLIAGGESGYTAVQAAIGAVLYAVVFLAVKVPVLSVSLAPDRPRRRITTTVLLINLVLFFALSAAMALLADVGFFQQ